MIVKILLKYIQIELNIPPVIVRKYVYEINFIAGISKETYSGVLPKRQTKTY